MQTLNSLDNISNEILDKIVELYKEEPKYRILDERTKISFEKPREYFLITNDTQNSTCNVYWTFIWIHNNLWQYRYMNTRCTDEANWKDPLQLLNELLNKQE